MSTHVHNQLELCRSAEFDVKRNVYGTTTSVTRRRPQELIAEADTQTSLHATQPTASQPGAAAAAAARN